VAAASLKRNLPGENSVRPVTTCQLASGSVRLVDFKTLKGAPAVLVKVNWNRPLVRVAWARVMGVMIGAALVVILKAALWVQAEST